MKIALRPQRADRHRGVPTSRWYRRSGLPIHPLLLLAVLVAALGAVLAVGFYMISARPVVLIIEGVRREMRTHQATVRELLNELALLIEPQDVVSPHGDTLITSGLVITIDKAHPVVVEVDGQRRRVLTHHIQPADILAEVGVTAGPYDAIYVDGLPLQGTLYAAPPGNIHVVRAIAVHVEEAGQVATLYTVSRTVGEVLHEANVQLYLADQVIPALDSPLSDGCVIRIERSVPVTILVDGRELATRTHGKTVGAALAEVGIALIGLDFAVPEEAAPLEPDMVIRVVRVTEEDEIERTEIDFRQVTRTDASIPPETQKVIQPGLKGVLELRVRVRREDGVEVSRSAPREVIVRAPRDEIVVIGATPSLIQQDTPQPPEPTAGS